jgi:L-aspartate oxidase
VVAAPSRETRLALWRHGGLVRDRAGLEALLGEPHELVRLIAAHALLREETRGAHMRSDFPDADPALEGRHTVTAGDDGVPAFELWA